MSWLETTSYIDTWRRPLETIGAAIGKTTEEIERVRAQADEDWLQYLVDEETEVIESLIGTAFVVCQTAITSVVSAAIDVAHCHAKERKKAFVGFPPRKSADPEVGRRAQDRQHGHQGGGA
jgi:hypothetical protein